MKAEEIELVRLLSLRALRAVRKFYSGKEVAKMLGISESLLSRYVKGRVVPSFSTATNILMRLDNNKVLEEIISKNIRIDKEGVVNIYFLAFNTNIIELAAYRAYKYFGDKKVNVVLTAAANGLPLATLVSYLLSSRLAVAKKEPDPSVLHHLEARVRRGSPPAISFIYLPKFVMRQGDRVLIVDDLLQSGKTLQALVSFCRKSGAQIIGIFALIALGREWEKSVPQGVDVKIVWRVEDKNYI